MIPDYAVPPGAEPAREESAPAGAAGAEAGSPETVQRARWSPESLERLAGRLAAEGPEVLYDLSAPELHEVWCEAIREMLDPESDVRRRLDPLIAAGCRLSRPALTAGLDAMLTGFTGEPARQLIERGLQLRERRKEPPPGLVAAVVAGNIPGLAVQVILPALAAGRPLLVKSASVEPFFAPALAHRLAACHPPIERALATVTWTGGDPALERPILAAAETLIAYGHTETLDDLRGRYDGRMIELGPKLSVAVVSPDADPVACGRALARDVAMFEQRGCLSVQTIFTEGAPTAIAAGLAAGLEELADLWPPPPLEATLAGEIQQLRRLADLSGLSSPDLPITTGTVLIESGSSAARPAALEPLPGGRTVRLQPVESLSEVIGALRPWRDRVQGVALAGAGAWRLAPDLSEMGVTRLAEPGELQRPDALWANGDRHLLELLGC